ncbi:MAG TPA: LysE family translocator [Hyphomicrobiaceae bacterium]|nr:LysE family translocator [Hyphomicrobiaceae bacterium]
MDLGTWIAFVAATSILLVIPGPTILLVVSYALGQGWRAAAPTAVGVALGDFTAMVASLAGLGALLVTSAGLFTALKWIGAAYLVYLGIQLFRADATLEVEARTGATGPVRMALHSWIVTALNPKSLTFFIAFVPQFLDPARPLLPQASIVVATFVVLAFVNAFGYALLASRARTVVRSDRSIRILNRAGGSALVTAGLVAALARPQTQ